MANFNKVIIAGNITRDIELRYTTNGTPVTDMGIAISEKSKDGKQFTVFVDCTVWGRQAEACSEYLGKGSPVLVEGKLTVDTWEKDGKKLSKMKVTAMNVQFLSRRGDGDSERSERSKRSKHESNEDSGPHGDDIPF